MVDARAEPPRSVLLLSRFALPIGALVVVALLLTESSTRTFVVANAAAQLGLFLAIACVPGWRTRRMSYVDIAWPSGLVALGVLTLALSDRSSLAVAVSVVYLVMGARMAIGATVMWRRGELDHELPRYRYQRFRWERASLGDERADLEAEILVQAVSNLGPMAVPGLLVVGVPGSDLGAVGALGLLLWAGSWVLESVADTQKLRFVAGSSATGSRTCCDVGLWRYSRHPNYFFQWMQWNAITVLSLPALVDAIDRFGVPAAAAAAVGLLGLSATMYWVLVHYTGAVPAEHFSVLKRPDYRTYQATTNRFFPGPSRRPS